MKKKNNVKVKRTDWKGKVEELNLIVEVQKDKLESDNKAYNKQYNYMKNNKNFWIGSLLVALIFATIVVMIMSQRIGARDHRIDYLEYANTNAVDEIHKCQNELTYVTGLYNKGYYEVINSADLTDTFFDCCYPVDCPQAVNNPPDCKCEYMLMCTESTIWG
jgi:hypothetical protein